MIFQIVNNSPGSKSYASGQVTVAPSSTTTVPANLYFATANDGVLLSDCYAANVFLSDGSNTFDVASGLEFLRFISRSAPTGTISPMINRTDVSTTASASGTSAAFPSDGLGLMSFIFNATAISGVNATIWLDVEASDDQTNWSAFYSIHKFTATGVERIQGLRLAGAYYRFHWFMSGTLPSATFSITTTLKDLLPKRSTIIIRYSDLDLTVNGNVSTTFTAGDTTNVSASILRAADGGNNGSITIQGSNDSLNWADLTNNITIAPNTTTVQTFSNVAFRYFRASVSAHTSAGTRVCDLLWGANS